MLRHLLAPLSTASPNRPARYALDTLTTLDTHHTAPLGLLASAVMAGNSSGAIFGVRGSAVRV